MNLKSVSYSERQRLKSLKELNIFESEPELDYDEIAKLAALIFNAPMSFISFVDEKKVWLKAKVGIEGSEFLAETSICHRVLLQDDLLVVSNAQLDPRFEKSGQVVGSLGIQFYAGIKIISPDGYPIGTLSVMDKNSNSVSESQKAALQGLSYLVTRLLSLRQISVIYERNIDELLIKKTALDYIAEGVVLHDNQGRIVEFNPGALNTLGLTAENFLGKTQYDPQWKAILEDGTPMTGDDFPSRKCLVTAKAQLNQIMGVNNSQNQTRWLNVNSVPILREDGLGVKYTVTSFNDITNEIKHRTEKQMLQAQVAQASKLSTLGEMASGIAHEINNPLAIIHGRTMLIKKKFSKLNIESFDIESDLKIIETTVDRIAKIVGGLRTYSRSAENDPFETVKMAQIIDETVSLTAEKIKQSGVELRVVCPEDVTVQARSAQISQVLMNLISNAEYEVQKYNEKWIEILVQAHGSRVIIMVTDSGQGIDPKIVSKLMEPFFTTKQVGLGTGLGLSISKNLIEQHGGKLYYDASCENTRFVIELPLGDLG